MTKPDITLDHIKLLGNMRFDIEPGTYGNTVASHHEWPFGGDEYNVAERMTEILGREVPDAEAKKLFAELPAIVTHMVRNAGNYLELAQASYDAIGDDDGLNWV